MMKELAERVQDLPQEIYDEIFELVFTVSSGKVEVGPEYKPPAQLAVNRAARKKFAAAYYGSDDGFLFFDKSLIPAWFDELEETHTSAIKKISYFDELIGEQEFTPPLCPLDIIEEIHELSDDIFLLDDGMYGYHRWKPRYWGWDDEDEDYGHDDCDEMYGEEDVEEGRLA